MDIQEQVRQFRPLLLALAAIDVKGQLLDDVVAKYMFMHEGEGLYAYKHSRARQYVYITEAGVVDRGTIDFESYSAS